MADMTVLAVDTPPDADERPAEPARWSARVAAVVLDSVLLAVLAWFVAPAASAPALWPGLPPGPALPDAATSAAGWASSPALVSAVVALLLLQGWTGATVGKRVVGLVVVDAVTGRPVGVMRTTLRQVAHVLDAILLVGYLRPLWESRRRTFADSLVRTVVVVSPWPPAWRPVPGPVDRAARPLAVMLCAVAVVGAFPLFSGASAVAVDAPCAVEPDAPVSSARVRLDVYRSWERRLGVRRELPVPPAPWVVEWRPDRQPRADENVLVRTTVTATDLRPARVWRGTSPNTTGEDDGVRLGEVDWSGDPATGSFRVDSTLLVDGSVVATCRVEVDVDAADRTVPVP